MKKKIALLCLPPLMFGIIAIVWGLMSWSNDAKNYSEIKEFREILGAAQKSLKTKEYVALERAASRWTEISAATKNPTLKWKSSYNSGRADLELFKEIDEEKTYRAARADFRETLRENPNFSDAKDNLTYLENLARERGVELEEIPTSSGINPEGTDPVLHAPSGGNDKENGDKTDLRNKLRGGSAPSLGGEAPMDMQSEINPEDIPKNPGGDY